MDDRSQHASPGSADLQANQEGGSAQLTTPAGLSELPPFCPACASLDLLAEPAVDEDERPTGLLLVTCAACGREVGELQPPEPSMEAEPEPLEDSLLPGPSEEPRSPS